MNIVFDLGGVVVRWEPESIIAGVFSDAATQDLVRKEILGHEDWVELDRGTLSWKEAVARGARRTALPEHEITRVLGAVPPSLVAIPESVELMYRLKQKGHALYCLSNMHVASIEHLEERYDFWGVFSGAVISCRVGMCKPEAAIYTCLLETYGLSALQTVFIDDRQENLDAASKFGIKTVLFEGAASCESALRELGCA